MKTKKLIRWNSRLIREQERAVIVYRLGKKLTIWCFIR